MEDKIAGVFLHDNSQARETQCKRRRFVSSTSERMIGEDNEGLTKEMAEKME